MSKFIDRLKKISKGETASIGFRRASDDVLKKQIQLVACCPQPDAAPEGVDAMLLEVSGKVTKTALKAIPDDVVWGAWLKSIDEASPAQLKDAGCDFMVVQVDTPLTLVSEKEIGKILEIDTSVNDYLVRTLLDLPVDAVLVSIPKENEGLTYQDLMTLKRFGSIPGKPLLVKLTTKATSAELEALWQAGVLAVINEHDTVALRQAIDEADFTIKKDKDTTDPILGVAKNRE